MNDNISQRIVAAYILTRDKIATLKAKHAEELKPLQDNLAKLELAMQNVLDKMGADSIKTPAGTAYLSSRVSITVADKSAFMDFVKEREMYELLDVRANKTAVEGVLTETQELPPGLNYSKEVTVGFRRA